MTADGRTRRRLTRDPAFDGYPSWSPDGRRIAFLRWHEGMADVYVMRADGTHVRRLTDDYGSSRNSAESDARPTRDREFGSSG